MFVYIGFAELNMNDELKRFEAGAIREDSGQSPSTGQVSDNSYTRTYYLNR